MIQRGDIVIVEFPYSSGERGKNRPALVIQCDRDNQRLATTIVAMITGNTRYAQIEPTQLLIDPATAEGKSSGLKLESAVKLNNVFTVDQGHILTKIGLLSPSLMGHVDASIKAAFGLA